MTVAPVRADESLARFVPADVGLFIEGRGLEDLLLPLTEPQAWLTLAELGGQPARIEETPRWRARLAQAVGMTPAEAISSLLSRQFAFVGEGPRRAQDGVVLCRPRTPVRALLKRWNAQPLPFAGRASVYRLPNRVGLAVPDGLLVFGDAGLANGMFHHVLGFVDLEHEARSLAEDPVFSALLGRVPENPDAVLFARLRRGGVAPAATTTTRAAPARAQPELPGPLRGASNVLLALHREGHVLHFSAVGDSVGRRRNGRTGLKDVLERLPERTLIAWGLHLDYPTLARAVDRLPEHSVLRLTLRLQERSGAIQRLTEALGSATCVAVGVVEPQARAEPAPPLPAVAILVDTRQPTAVAAEIDTLMQATVSVYNLLSLKVGAQPLPTAESIQVADTTAGRLDLSQLVRVGLGSEVLPELHVCWAIDGDTLIVTSHANWLRQILVARHGEGPTLAGLLKLSQRPVKADSETIIAIQTGPIADLGQLWLDYLARSAPDVLDEDWWRQRQPSGNSIRLGIQVTEVPEDKRLLVTAVEPGWPADGVLKPGDEIVGYERRRFATSQPVGEIRRGIVQRRNARWVDLLVDRGGTTLVRRVPLPFVDPVQVLRRAIAVGRIGQRVVYHDDVPEPAGGRGLLTVELRQTRERLFPFSLTPRPEPAAQPAQPAP